jgi:serine phosphatase RsbU (regulator of sigma subunit)
MAEGRDRRFLAAAISRPVIAVLLIGVLVTGVTARAADLQYNSNEKRLLALRVKDAGSLLTAALPGLQTPLASAAELAAATGGDPARFRAFMSTKVETQQRFVSSSLWSVRTPTPSLVTSLGSAPAIASRPSELRSVLERAAHGSTLVVTSLLSGPSPRIGYAYGVDPFVVYVESRLPANRKLRIASDSSFAGLTYALYLGRSAVGSDLIATNASQTPIGGRHSSAVVPFGDSAFTLVMSSRKTLSGGLSQDSPWIALGAGLAITAAAAIMVERLVRRRKTAEELARLTRKLYSEQRDNAEMLQRALLPDALPEIEGVEMSARYVPGVEGVEVGGDWYDVVRTGDKEVLLMIGDVCGRGLRSAVIMASLRHSARAYAAQGDAPELILTKLSDLLASDQAEMFATLLCASVDVRSRRVSVANAGHLPLLVLNNGSSQFIAEAADPPIGVSRTAVYGVSSHTLDPNSTVLAFTDGLIERRDASITDGLGRLTDAVRDDPGDLDGLISRIVDELTSGHLDDDTAILGLRWTQ